jgi:hypothetical protein
VSGVSACQRCIYTVKLKLYTLTIFWLRLAATICQVALSINCINDVEFSRLRIHQALILCPSCVPEDVGIYQK